MSKPTTNGLGAPGTVAGAGDTPPSPFTGAAPAGAAKKLSEVLGEITWLMSQSPIHRTLMIADLEWLVMTPALLQQFRLFYGAPPAAGGGTAEPQPIGVVLWALVSAEVEERLAKGIGRMRPEDWRSGDRAWVVEVIAPFGGAEAMLADLKAKVLAGREVKVVKAGVAGKEVVVL